MASSPRAGTLKVSVEDGGYTQAFTEYDPATSIGDWTYSEPRSSVTFLDYTPNPGAVVQIQYDVLASGERD